MPVAPTLQKYLDQTVTYEMISHDPTMSSTRTAEACHVRGTAWQKALCCAATAATCWRSFRPPTTSTSQT